MKDSAAFSAHAGSGEITAADKHSKPTDEAVSPHLKSGAIRNCEKAVYRAASVTAKMFGVEKRTSNGCGCRDRIAGIVLARTLEKQHNVQTVGSLLPVFVCCAVLFNVGTTIADDWPSFRGGAMEGRIASNHDALLWSEENNVDWSVTVPGEGHSSPVVYKDNVLITTAYTVDQPHPLIGVFRTLLLTAPILFLVLSIPLLSKTLSSQSGFARGDVIAFSSFAFLMGLTIYLTWDFCLEVVGDNHNDTYYRWIRSGAITGLSLMLAALMLNRRSPWRILIGIVAVSAAIGLIVFRPDAGYYTLDNFGRPHTFQTWLTVAFLAAFGVGIAVTTLLRIRASWQLPVAGEDLVEDLGTRSGKFLILILFALGVVGLGVVPILVSARVFKSLFSDGSFAVPGDVVTNYDRLLYFWDYTFLGFWNPRAVLLILALVALVLIERPKAGLRWVDVPPRKAFRRFAVIVAASYLGGLCLVQTLYRPQSTTSFVRAVLCYARSTGELKWKLEDFPGPKSKTHSANSPATPTPICHDDKVFAYFGSAGILCADMRGNKLWSRTDLPFEDIHGVGASPVLHEGNLIVLNGMPTSSYITSIDSVSGERIWTTQLDEPWTNMHGAHRPPYITSYNDRDMIVVWQIPDYRLKLVDFQTGEIAYDEPFDVPVSGESVASIVTGLEPDVFLLPNRSGVYACSLSRIRLDEDPIVWTAKLRSLGPNTATPVLVNGLLFCVDDKGVGSVVDAETGKTVAKRRLCKGSTLSSPICIGNFVYVSNDRGETVVVTADRAFRVTATNRLPGSISATLAKADEQLFIRTTDRLWCIRAGSNAPADASLSSKALHSQTFD